MGRPPGAIDGEYLTVGTTDRVSTLDPAGAYDNGSFQVENQVYPFLMNFTPGTGDLKPDLAAGCGFENPTLYRCTLKPGSVFANGHELTSSDVKFSYDRERVINDPNGPQSLLANLDRVETPDDLTVDFRLKLPNDQTFPQVLATNAGPVVDEEVFPPDRLLDDDAIARAEPFAGPYTITSHTKNQLIGLRANPKYVGGLGKPQWDLIGIKYYTGGENLKIDIENRAIDVAYRSLSPNDIETLSGVRGRRRVVRRRARRSAGRRRRIGFGQVGVFAYRDPATAGHRACHRFSPTGWPRRDQTFG